MLRLSNWRFLSILLILAGTNCRAQSLEERMQEIVQPYADEQMFMGNVLVAKNGNVIFSKSYGMADVEWNIPNSPVARFNIASTTKQFTAASILLLEERGKLRTDDLVKKYLPEAPASWDNITIYNLLTHTSGIPDDAATYVPGTPDKLIFHDKPLNFQPGEKWSYVNLGYMTLGYLIEKISGQTYADFLKDNIFKPLGMNDSGLESNVTLIPHRAIGYWPGENGIENAERPDWRVGFSAGSIYSTTEDLLRWEEGLFGGKLLSPASLRKMTTPFRSDYACGLYVKNVNGRRMIQHDGNNIGYNAEIEYFPEERLAVIVLANLNGTVTWKLGLALAALANGENPLLPPIHKEIRLPATVLARYIGTYHFSANDIEIALEGNHIVSRFTEGGSEVFAPESETKFFSKAWDFQLEFLKNEKGDYATLLWLENGKVDKGTKK